MVFPDENSAEMCSDFGGELHGARKTQWHLPRRLNGWRVDRLNESLNLHVGIRFK